MIYEYDETTQEFHLRGGHQIEKELVEALRSTPIRLGRGAIGQAATTRAPVEVTDILDERQYAATRVRPMLTTTRLSVVAGGAASARGSNHGRVDYLA